MIIGRLDICHAVTLLASTRCTLCPHKGHMEQAKQAFRYLKKWPNRHIMVNLRDQTTFLNCKATFEKEYVRELQELDLDAYEEVYANVPEPLIDEKSILVFLDLDYVHDKVTRRPVTGMMVFVGQTPIFFLRKKQVAVVATSTYRAEFRHVEDIFLV
jgi:hypothetical protein